MGGFEVMQQEDGGLVIVYLKGFLDAHTAPQLEGVLQKCLEEKKYKIIVNFKDLSYISSAGLGVFMGFIEEVRRHDGDIKLTNMSPKIYRVFDLLGFPALYEIFDTEDEAKQKFNGAS